MVPHTHAMEIELELDTKMKDISEVIEKLSPILKSVKDLGFVVKELEIESGDDEEEENQGTH
jgi:hypothetical protein